MLAREYGWLPHQSDALDWADIVSYREIINKRLEKKNKEKIEEYITLLSIVHTPEPGQLMNCFQNMLSDKMENNDDEIGDMKKLEALRFQAGGGLRHGDR